MVIVSETDPSTTTVSFSLMMGRMPRRAAFQRIARIQIAMAMGQILTG